MSGEPKVDVAVDAVPRSNVVVNLYDIAPSGRALMISRGTMLFRGAGAQDVKFDMYGQDAPIAKAHRIGVLLSGSNSDWWGLDVPTNTNVTVESARIGLPFLTFQRTKFLAGKETPDLKSYLQDHLELTRDATKEATTRFVLPPKLKRR